MVRLWLPASMSRLESIFNVFWYLRLVLWVTWLKRSLAHKTSTKMVARTKWLIFHAMKINVDIICETDYFLFQLKQRETMEEQEKLIELLMALGVPVGKMATYLQNECGISRLSAWRYLEGIGKPSKRVIVALKLRLKSNRK